MRQNGFTQAHLTKGPRYEECLRGSRQKELELARLEKEVEALRVAAPLLSDDKESMLEATSNKPTLATPTTTQQPIRIPQAAVNASPQAGSRSRLGRYGQTLALSLGAASCSVREVQG